MPSAIWKRSNFPKCLMLHNFVAESPCIPWSRENPKSERDMRCHQHRPPLHASHFLGKFGFLQYLSPSLAMDTMWWLCPEVLTPIATLVGLVSAASPELKAFMLNRCLSMGFGFATYTWTPENSTSFTSQHLPLLALACPWALLRRPTRGNRMIKQYCSENPSFKRIFHMDSLKVPI